MQATARLKYLMMSPRKVRRVVSLVKGKSVDEALTILRFTNKAAAGPLAKTIKAATANALAIEGTSKIKAEDLSIARINVDEGPRAKRIRFRAMGRVYRYKKRFAHLTVVVEGEPREEVTTKKRRAAKTVKETETPKKAPARKAKTTKAGAKKTTKKAAVKKTTTSKTKKAAPKTKKTAPKKTAKKAAPKAGTGKKKTAAKSADKGKK